MANMAESTTESEEPQPNTPASESNPATSEGDPALEDAGKKAIAAERRARAAAEKQAKQLKDRLDAIEAEKLSEQERAVKAAEDARSEAEAAKAEAIRWRIAARHGLSDEDAELFLTATDEETLNRQAERLKERTPQPAKGAHVPNLGQQPEQPPNLDEQIRMAEASGDTQTAMSLKTLKLAELARQSR